MRGGVKILRREREQERSTTWLRNRGVGREMLRLIQSKGAPVRRIFRQLAELGVPCSMTEGLTGCKLADWASAKPRHEAALQALWQLAETYTDVANRVPGALEGLDEVVLEAQALGVYYDPPACADDLIRKRARKGRQRFVEAEENTARPGRTIVQEQLMAIVRRSLSAEPMPLSRTVQQVVDLRLQGMNTAEISMHVTHSEHWVGEVLKRPEVVAAIAAVKPLDEVEALCRARTNAKRAQTLREANAAGKVPKSAGRPKSAKLDDAWLIARRDEGWTLQRIAVALGTTKQTIAYRMRQADAARANTPTPLKRTGEPGGLPLRFLEGGAPEKVLK